MKVWVGCLGCYNAGELRGEWVDALEATEVTASRLGLTPSIYDLHEEMWVFDYEDTDGFLTGECSPMEAQAVAEAVERLPDYVDLKAVAAWLKNSGGSVADMDLESFEEAFQGEWNSEEEFAENLATDLGSYTGGEGWPLNCIDWERAARDLFLSGDYWSTESEGGVFVFDGRV